METTDKKQNTFLKGGLLFIIYGLLGRDGLKRNNVYRMLFSFVIVLKSIRCDCSFIYCYTTVVEKNSVLI